MKHVPFSPGVTPLGEALRPNSSFACSPAQELHHSAFQVSQKQNKANASLSQEAPTINRASKHPAKEPRCISRGSGETGLSCSTSSLLAAGQGCVQAGAVDKSYSCCEWLSRMERVQNYQSALKCKLFLGPRFPLLLFSICKPWWSSVPHGMHSLDAGSVAVAEFSR